MFVARDRGHLNNHLEGQQMDAQENETMTRVGPGTPAGETLRRYWLPINFSDEVKTDEPKIVRRLAEDRLLT